VLDLDETLVSAYESSGLPPIVRAQAVEAGLHCFDMECISTDKVPNFFSCYFSCIIILIATDKGFFFWCDL
jgi:hypothetical protein